MEFSKLLKQRYSVRNYLDKRVEDEKLNMILEAGRLAPSACNSQPWKFIVVRSEEGVKSIHSCYKREWIESANLFIVICGDHNSAWHRAEDNKDHTDIDVSIAIDHMTLQATDIGLGTCWICNFDYKKCSEFLNIPETHEPIAILPIGYPTEKGTPIKKRKAFDEVVTYEKF